VTASVDKTARLWDARDGTQLRVLSGHDDQLSSAAYSPDGKRIVTASDDKTIRIYDAAIAADLEAQVLWATAAQLEQLTEAERTQAGLESIRDVKTWSSNVSDCDKAAAAIYDPDRLAPGLEQTTIDADLAYAACAKELSKSPNSVRDVYQMGRALIAKHDFAGARREFEIAVSNNYVAARIDLANLLLDPNSAMLDPTRAISLYEKSWQAGVSVAAYFLGRFYENGVTGSSPTGQKRTADVLRRAWQWYQKGSEVGEPNANARLAERDEERALAEDDPLTKDTLLLGAFKLYAFAAERATEDAWPEDSWRQWRYRRASLARLLAKRGKMSEVGHVYADVLVTSKSQPQKFWAEIFAKLRLIGDS
jgi:TPR repeat protein